MKRRGRLIGNSGPSRAGRQLNTPVHPELVKRVKVLAIEDDSTITKVIHEILCRELNRMDLIDQVPEPVKQLTATGT